MSNTYQITTKAELNKEQLNRLINGRKNVFRIPEDRGDANSFFETTLGKESCPEAMQGHPDDLTMTIGKHGESARGAEHDEYHVIFQYSEWKQRAEICEVEFLKDYSSKISQDVIDLDSSIQGRHFLDILNIPYFVYAYVYADGKVVEYNSNEEVMKHLSFYESMENL